MYMYTTIKTKNKNKKFETNKNACAFRFFSFSFCIVCMHNLVIIFFLINERIDGHLYTESLLKYIKQINLKLLICLSY